ncbi:hypothetical protein J0B03_06735 [Alkalibacter rhizosphaerae]|uniref:Alcohol acetyltransferase n=1 Tax=Alkalibacter rhizosphaerae TaxID=2815577 RepID=A0A975AGH3_9FIRM|nr:hypothetical protein [Alkalibacter rhizosphaerae]QSX07534.1 hypothetical protein J0B03_06735 [Alkalibacter rhizosphaerae]
MNKKWFRLDNIGRLYASIANYRDTTMFRLSAVFKEEVDPAILGAALQNVMPRFPYFATHVKRGIFWYYIEENTEIPVPTEERYFPCMHYQVKKKGNFPFRVLYYKRRLSVEFTHIITDGTGGLIFLQTLIREYVRLMKKETATNEELQRPGKDVLADEVEDSFSKYYKKGYPASKKGGKAFHLPYKLLPKGVFHVVTGTVELADIKRLSKEKGVTITEFLIGVYFKTILDRIEKKGYKKRPVVLNVPANLRLLYPSKTMRNFFAPITPMLDPRLGTYSFDEILRYVKNFMEMQVDKKYMDQIISRNVKNERHWILRTFPVFIKDLIMPWIYHFYGERGYTSGFSNVGLVSLGEELEKEVESVHVYPAPSSGNIIKVTCVGFKGKIHITFGKLTLEKELEREFFRNLVEMGMEVMIETNLEG